MLIVKYLKSIQKKKPGGPITDEDIKEFFSEATESEIESALCGLPKFLDRVKKVLGSQMVFAYCRVNCF